MSETQPKSEIISFYPIFFVYFQTFILSSGYIEQNCHVLMMTLKNLNLACQDI